VGSHLAPAAAHNAPVAQPDRVVASEAIGRGFESLRARHLSMSLRRDMHSSKVWPFGQSSKDFANILAMSVA
jgi:hypothetical protein